MSERLVGILVDSFGKILLPGLTVTIPLTVISFTLALIIAVVVALVQFSESAENQLMVLGAIQDGISLYL